MSIPPKSALAWFACGILVVPNPTTAGDASVSRAPYIQMASPDAATVVWRTQGAIRPVVRYGASPDELDQRTLKGAITVRVSPDRTDSAEPRLHSAPVGTFQYEARLSGLTPATQ